MLTKVCTFLRYQTNYSCISERLSPIEIISIAVWPSVMSTLQTINLHLDLGNIKEQTQYDEIYNFTNPSLPQIEIINIDHKSLPNIIGPYFLI